MRWCASYPEFGLQVNLRRGNHPRKELLRPIEKWRRNSLSPAWINCGAVVAIFQGEFSIGGPVILSVEDQLFTDAR